MPYTYSILLDDIKNHVWWVNANIDPKIWHHRIEDAFRSFTINSGMTRLKRVPVPGQPGPGYYQFTALDKIYYIVHVYPLGSTFGETGFFNVFQQNWFHLAYNAWAGNYDFERLILTKSFSEMLRANMGQGIDFHYDKDSQELWLNTSLNYQTLLIEYLPIWSLNQDDSDTISDEMVYDWVKHYCVALTKADFYEILKSGAAFDLPDGAEQWANERQNLKDMEKDLRKRAPLLGANKT